MNTHLVSVDLAPPTPTTSDVTRMMWAIATVWLALSLALGATGLLTEHARFIGPFAVLSPLGFVLAFATSSRIRAWAFALETRTLVTAQALRIGGFAFIAVYAVGQLNGKFALWAGGIDCVVGLSALFAGYYLTPARTVQQRRLLMVWMALGIIDFPVAVVLARIARAQDPASMMALTALPLPLITTWGVPIALIAYFILGAHLWRQRNGTIA
jgi:hypothetical protein